MSSSQATGQDRLWSPVGSESSTKRYTYDTAYPGNVRSISFLNPDGSTETTQFTYDPSYNAYPSASATTVQKPDGSVSTVTAFTSYDFFGRMTEYGTRDESLATSNRYAYDSVGRLIQVDYPAVDGVAACKTWAYDDFSRTVTVTDENGHLYTEVYDALGRFVELRRPLGGVTKTIQKVSYNSLGGIAFEEDAEGHRTCYYYDAFGRKIRITYPDLAEDLFEYGVLASDPDGAVTYVKATDANGNWTRQFFDANGRVVKVEELVSASPETIVLTKYKYDFLDRLIQVTDAENQVTAYTYGLWDQPASLDLPGSMEPVHTFGYDGRGRKIVEDAGNSWLVTRYTYDALGRLTKAIYPTGQSAWFFYNKDGQLTEARLYKQDGTLGSVTRATYDARGRKTSESWTIGGKTYTLSFGLDPAGNMTSLTYPDGTTVQYVYDEWNRLVAIPGFFGQSEFSPGFQYRDTGFLERIIRANGITTAITPDARMRPVSFQDTAISISYTYDGEGNVLSQNGLAYGYDGLDRLISAQVPEAGGGVRTVRYTYDKVGNRLTETWDGQAPKAYAYSPGNYLVTAGDAAYSYGSFGELRQKQTASSVTEYIYDGARRMVGVRAGGDGGRTVRLRCPREENLGGVWDSHCHKPAPWE